MPVRKKTVEQYSFLGILGVPVIRDETKDKKASGGHTEKHKPAERTAHEIQNPATRPIVTRIIDGVPAVVGRDND